MTELSDLESQRYDRQVRVWGAEAQLRLQNSKVLVSGLRGLHPELIKNLVLAGTNVFLQDHSIVYESDLSSNFFLKTEDIGRLSVEACLPRIQSLNQFAKISLVSNSIDELNDNFFQNFDVIFLEGCTKVQALRINSLCRNRATSDVGKQTQSPFFWSGVIGFEGWLISDFGDSFEYKDDPPNNKTILTASFPSLDDLLARRWADLTSRFFPLSLTLVKSQLLETFMNRHSHPPYVGFESTLLSLWHDMAIENGYSSLSLLVSSSDVPSSNPDTEISSLCSLFGYAPTAALSSSLSSSSTPSPSPSTSSLLPAFIITCSILGSFLSQECIKAISKSGEPCCPISVFTAWDFSLRSIPVHSSSSSSSSTSISPSNSNLASISSSELTVTDLDMDD